MKLALFDLDHTVLDGDTNILWIEHLQQLGFVNTETVARQQQYMALYVREKLDMAEYMGFHMELLSQRSLSEWQPILTNFVQTQLQPRLAPDALAAMASHRAAGHRVALVTATNAVLVGALARTLGVHAIASEVEVHGDRLTGRAQGLPSFREHKITRVQDWVGLPLADPAITESHFYSDSANDLPLLLAVSHPVAVNPDAKLHSEAQARGWPMRRWLAPAVLAD